MGCFLNFYGFLGSGHHHFIAVQAISVEGLAERLGSVELFRGTTTERKLIERLEGTVVSAMMLGGMLGCGGMEGGGRWITCRVADGRKKLLMSKRYWDTGQRRGMAFFPN